MPDEGARRREEQFLRTRIEEALDGQSAPEGVWTELQTGNPTEMFAGWAIPQTCWWLGRLPAPPDRVGREPSRQPRALPRDRRARRTSTAHSGLTCRGDAAPAGDCAAQRGSPRRAVRGAPALHWSDVDLHAGLRLRWLLTCPAARERQSLPRRAAGVPVSRSSP